MGSKEAITDLNESADDKFLTNNIHLCAGTSRVSTPISDGAGVHTSISGEQSALTDRL